MAVGKAAQGRLGGDLDGPRGRGRRGSRSDGPATSAHDSRRTMRGLELERNGIESNVYPINLRCMAKKIQARSQPWVQSYCNKSENLAVCAVSVSSVWVCQLCVCALTNACVCGTALLLYSYNRYVIQVVYG